MVQSILMVLATSFSFSIASAQELPLSDSDYALKLAEMGNVDLSLELSKNLAASGWFCGGEYARIAREQFEKGQSANPQEIENKSPACRQTIANLKQTITETRLRLASQVEQVKRN